jgi:hypothetical protein
MGFHRLKPMLETLYFAIGAIRKWQSLTHGPEDRVTGEQPEIRAGQTARWRCLFFP